MILGLADGLDAGAALVRGDKILGAVRQASVDHQPRSRAFPWDAARAVLAKADVGAEEVGLVAVAGRFTPPFFVRRHPGIHAFTRDPFSSLHGANLFWQRVLRSSGFGAVEADRAVDWLDGKVRRHGLTPRRTVLVDVHRALAAASYRTQPRARALVVVVHPRGDGLLASVYRGRAGQLDRVYELADMGALQVHLARCQVSLGLDPWTGEAALWSLAAGGHASPVVVNQLRQELWIEDGVATGRSAAGGSVGDLPWSDLRDEDPADAAAAVTAHLGEVVRSLVRFAQERFGRGNEPLVVGGAWMAGPRLIADLAELEGVSEVIGAPLPGHASRALGAAASQAGTAPQALWSPPTGAADAPPEVLEALAQGAPVVRWAGPPSGARHGAGAASVLVRPAGGAVVARSLRAHGAPGVVALPGVFEVVGASALAGPMARGTAAVKVATVPPGWTCGVAADQRVQLVIATGGLARLLAADRDHGGLGGLVAWPAAIGDAPPTDLEVVRVARAAGARWVEREEGWSKI